jgi:opacity protein-like surface antigen
MKNLIFMIWGLIALNLAAQDSKFSVEANYPVSFGDSFFAEGYEGLIDIGVDYKFFNFGIINLGASFNGGIFNLTEDNRPPFIDVSVYMVQPRVFGELYLEALSRLRPSVGLGYSFMIYNITSSQITLESTNGTETESGINLNLGLSFDITKKLFIQAQYDFIQLSDQEGIPNSSVNSKINIFKAGLGYRF